MIYDDDEAMMLTRSSSPAFNSKAMIYDDDDEAMMLTRSSSPAFNSRNGLLW